MIEYTMLQLADVDNKIIGDCYRTAIACVLEREPSEVPHFMDFTWGEWEARKWLKAEYGLTIAQTRVDKMSNGWVLNLAKGEHDVFHLMIGDTVRGLKHAVVGRNGSVVWDPHPSRAGLTTVTEMEFLIPLNYAKSRATSAD